jgi:hypothetical protein
MPRRLALVTLFSLSLVIPGFAQETVTSGLAPEEGDQGTIFKILEAGDNYFAARYQCSDPTFTSTLISVAVTDGATAGDIWRATLFKGTKKSSFQSTANVAQFVAGAPAFAPGAYSPNATIAATVRRIDVVVGLGNGTPGGFPARGTLRIKTDAGGPVCARKQQVHGIAEP